MAAAQTQRRSRDRQASELTGLIDPNSLMRIKSLEMRAKVVVEGFFAGLHRSPYHGFSVEFSEHRRYAPGDDPKDAQHRELAGGHAGV